MFTKTEAEKHTIALLPWFAENPPFWEAFAQQGGLAREGLSAQTHNPDFLIFVLDFVLSDDRVVMSASEFLGLRPEDFVKLHYALSGNLGEDSWGI